MPTYVVTAIHGRFSGNQKSRLASVITDIHCKATGAPSYLAQVIFTEVPAENYYIGGKPLRFDNIYVHGQIRAGRSREVKERIVLEIMHAAAMVAETDRSCVQVYLDEIPAHQMSEWGRILPEPGKEAEWDAAIPPAVKERMKSLL